MLAAPCLSSLLINYSGKTQIQVAYCCVAYSEREASAVKNK